MRVLFAVDSVFQLITAVNLRFTKYADAKADIIIYNSTANSKVFYSNLSQTEAFDKYYYAKTSLTYCGDKYTFKEKFPKYFVYIKSLIDSKRCLKRILGEITEKYDQFLFNGIGALPECIFNVCKKINPNLICFRFEDSYLSYTQLYGSKKGVFRICLERISEILFNRVKIENNIRGYYFSAPEMVQYQFPYPILYAPKFSRKSQHLLEILNKTFAYEKTIDDYHEKYIFFECGDAFFFNNSEDLEYIKSLTKIVGGNNILIKRHPRIIQNRFENLGVHIANGTSVPWELIQMNTSLENKIFITTKSAAALTSEIYFGDKCDVILLYKGIKGKQGKIEDNFEKYIQCFQKKSKNKFWLPIDINSFENIIRKIEK